MATIEDYHFVNQYKGQKKKRIVELLKKQKELRKREMESFNNLLVYPLRDINKTLDQVLKSELPIEVYKKRSEKFKERVKKIFERG